MKSHRHRRLQELPVDGAQDPHVTSRAPGRHHDGAVLVDQLQEIADNERDALEALNLLLRPPQLLFQVLLFVLDAILPDLEELQLAPQRLEAPVEVLLLLLPPHRGGGGRCSRPSLLRLRGGQAQPGLTRRLGRGRHLRTTNCRGQDDDEDWLLRFLPPREKKASKRGLGRPPR